MKYRKFKALIIILMMVTPLTILMDNIISTSYSEKSTNSIAEISSASNNPEVRLKPIDDHLIRNPIKTDMDHVDSLVSIGGITWTDPPGTWWDTDWEYRVNITVREPGVANRSDWPVTVYMKFSPHAYKYSVRIIDPNGGEIPSQVWNITYVNTTHIESCSVTFLIDINKNEEKTYALYWSIDETDPPTYPKRITFYEHEGVYYIYSLKGWHLTLPSSNGGKASTFHFNDSNLEHQSSTINDEITHFGAILNATLGYEGYWGEYNTNNNQYIFRGIREVNNPLEQIYAGVIFVTYEVEAVPLKNSAGESIANETYYYQFFDWGINVYEEVTFTSNITNGLIYIGGWIFDQDNGEEGSRFSVIYPPEKTLPSETWELLIYDEFTTLDTDTWYVRSNDAGYPNSDGDSLVLTRNVDGKYGQAWLNQEIDSDFMAEFSFWIGGTSDSGADGLIFMFYKSKDYSPGTGGSLGFSGSGTYYGYGVEVDTYGNSGSDPYGVSTRNDAGHIAIMNNTYQYHLNHTMVLRSELREQWHTMRVQVIGDTVKVWYDGNLILTYSDPGFLDRTYKWIGFSAATGGLNDYHKIGYFKLWVRNPGCEGEDIYTEKDYTNGTYIGIFNNDTRVGIGTIFCNLEFSGTSQAIKVTVYNEGNQTNDNMLDSEDYIYAVVNITSANVSNGDRLALTYTIFPWNTTNDITTSEAKFDELVNMFKTPLLTGINKTERFKILVTVRVVDGAGEVIPNANVTLTNGTLKYTGYTDENGEITFDVYRVEYQFLSRITNNINATYENTTLTIAYNDTTQWHYCNLTDEVIIKFVGVYEIELLAYAADNETILQDGLLNLNDSTTIYRGYTNLTGGIKFYIKAGTWTMKFNHTSTNEVWDYFNLTQIGVGQIATETQRYDISVSDNIILRLIDVNATQPPEITWLELYETSSTYEKYWNEEITIKVKFYRSLNRDLIEGNITWFVVDQSDALFLRGFVNTTNGMATFTINTSYLVSDKSYIVIINASKIYTTPQAQGFALPSPLNVFIRVKARPIDISTTINPSSTIYYMEEVYVTVVLKDYFTGSDLTQANVTLKISGVAGITQLNEISSGTYQSYLPQLEANVYTLTITAQKSNYTTIVREYILRVIERPTSISAPISIEIPWNETYSFTVDYIDTRLSSHIGSAEAKYSILNSRTGEIIVPDIIIQEKGNYYVVKVDIQGNNLNEDNYLLQISIGKKNYINQTVTIPFTIRLRQTSLEKETSTIRVYYGETFGLKVYFYDLDNESAPIIQASRSFMINDFETGDIIDQGDLADLNNGTYYLTYDTSTLQVRNYYITITIYKEHYAPSSVVVNLIVEAIPTVAFASKISETIEWGTTTTFIIVYNDSRTGAGVSADKAVFEIANGSQWSSGELPLEVIGAGIYKLTINTTEEHLVPGTYKITVFLNKQYYENRTLVLTLTITNVETYAYAQPANVTLYWGAEAEIKVFYNMTREKVNIEAEISYTVRDLDNGTLIPIENLIQAEDEYYLIRLNSSSLSDGHRYIITITLTKAYYVSATITIHVKVLAIPVTASASPQIVDLTWGDEFNFTLILINTLNQEYLTDVTIDLFVYVEGEPVDVENAITYYLIGNTFLIFVKTGLLNITAYTIFLNITKNHYDIPDVEFIARVHSVEITVSLRTDRNIYKNPITSETKTKVEITLVESGTATPISGASVSILIMRGEVAIKEIEAEESIYYPGVYTAVIDWTNIELGDYTLRVVIKGIQRRGYETSNTDIFVASGSTELGVSIDYFGGSTVIAGKPYPNLLVYPIIITVFVTVGFVSYKYYSWLKLPVEVREIDKLIKAIEKGVLEYVVPSRDETFKEVIRKALE